MISYLLWIRFLINLYPQELTDSQDIQPPEHAAARCSFSVAVGAWGNLALFSTSWRIQHCDRTKLYYQENWVMYGQRREKCLLKVYESHNPCKPQTRGSLMAVFQIVSWEIRRCDGQIVEKVGSTCSPDKHLHRDISDFSDDDTQIASMTRRLRT